MEHEKQFRIGELAKEVGVERFVIRFWEKEFKIKANRTDGGQRVYSETDLTTFKAIKDLLYNQGFTIEGALHQLQGPSKKPVSQKVIPARKIPDTIFKQLESLQAQLKQLQELL